ncbi:MAG: sulfatase-like hydrolase/transferase [Rikenellaceae bacterium]
MKQPAAMLGFVLVGGAYVSFASECQAQTMGNILVIVADDLGKELLSIYDTPTTQRAKTPNIDRLAERGVVFNNFWGYPLSAPVRAAMLTGRYGHHTSIVNLDITLPLEEKTLFEALPDSYTNALIGKWHLSRDTNFAPDYGIDYFAGIAMGGGVRDYYNWQLTENGKTTNCTEYSTTKITDLAKGWIEKQDSEWVCWVAYNAPHTPYHIPPKGTYSGKLKKSADEMANNPLPYFIAMTESMDYEIGRLLESVDDNTTIIFVGDNGTENKALQSPYPSRHGKGTLYEAGVSVPLVVCGKGVSQQGTRCDALISSVDIFPTVMELSGKMMSQYEDSFSFASALQGGDGQRTFNFSEINNQRSGYMNAVSDGRYKIITQKGKTTMLFDLAEDPLEMKNLIGGELSQAEAAALERLEGELKRMNIPEIAAAENKNMGNNRPQGGNRPQMRNNSTTQNRVRQ